MIFSVKQIYSCSVKAHGIFFSFLSDTFMRTERVEELVVEGGGSLIKIKQDFNN